MANSSDIAQSDLAELLNVLGMGDHARPQSPHEVFQEALRVLRARVGKPAPDSTRTGAAETGCRLIGPKMTREQEERIAHNLCDEFGPEAVVANAAFAKAFYAELYAAARPEAPSDAGWRDIRTAPKDDTLVDLGFWASSTDDMRWISVSGWYEAGPADRCWYSAYDEERIEPTHWRPLGALPTPPSDPAPSGQAEG